MITMECEINRLLFRDRSAQMQSYASTHNFQLKKRILTWLFHMFLKYLVTIHVVNIN